MEGKDPYLLKNYARCYSIFAEDLRRFVYRYVKDESVSEEIVQDVFLKLLESEKNIDPAVQTTRGFLFIVARNKALDYLRKRRNEFSGLKKMVIQEATMDTRFFNSLDDAYIEGEIISTIHDVIDELPQHKKDIFIKREFLRIKIREIIEETGASSFVINRIIREVYHEIRKRIRPFLDGS